VTDVAARATYREVFAEPVFRVLFLSRTLAIGADTLRILALSVLVLEVTGSVLLSAATFGIGFVPQVIGGTLFGAFADRLAPRRLIAAGYLLECAGAALLALGDLPVAAMLGIVALIAAMTPVFSGSSNRLVAERLSGDAYVLGRSLSTVASAAAQLFGLAAGAAAVAALDARTALLVTAACHLVAALTVRLGLPRLPRPTVARDSAVRQSWRVTGGLLGDRTVRALLLVQWLPPACITGAEALVVSYVAHRGFPPGSAGVVLACAPLGMLVGNLLMARVVRPRMRERLVSPVLLLVGLTLALLAVPASLAVVAGLFLIAGAGFSYSLGVQQAFLDALPAQWRGQGFGLLSTGLMTLQGVGPLLLGVVAEYGSIGSAMVVAGAGTATVGIAWWLRARHAPVMSRSAPGLG
jgi:predicted MFS family arabinose efflux permease